MLNSVSYVPEKIITFLESQHILSLSTLSQETPNIWPATCFYIPAPNRFESSAILYFMSEMHTEHAKRILVNPQIAGTISVNTRNVSAIEGIQFLGECQLLSNTIDSANSIESVLNHYCEAFPAALKHQAPLWELKLTYIKFTSNKEKFGEKLVWQAEAK